jgi:hypothetical protein
VVLQKLLTETFCLFLGVSKLTQDHLLITSKEELAKLLAKKWVDLPFINGSKKIWQVRFVWSELQATL